MVDVSMSLADVEPAASPPPSAPAEREVLSDPVEGDEAEPGILTGALRTLAERFGVREVSA